MAKPRWEHGCSAAQAGGGTPTWLQFVASFASRLMAVTKAAGGNRRFANRSHPPIGTGGRTDLNIRQTGPFLDGLRGRLASFSIADRLPPLSIGLAVQ